MSWLGRNPNRAMNEAQTSKTSAGPQAESSVVNPRIILVPVDFSEPAREALDYAVAFAIQFQARLILLHVVEIPYVGSGLGEIELPPVDTEIRGSVDEHLGRIMAEQVGNRLPAETLTRSGQPWYEITEAAREIGADLIIIGTHGYTGLKHVLMGSTAERVVRHATCPVLVVRNRGK
jgi:nucleotide-binding universal stress UspA family protein